MRTDQARNIAVASLSAGATFSCALSPSRPHFASTRTCTDVRSRQIGAGAKYTSNCRPTNRPRAGAPVGLFGFGAKASSGTGSKAREYLQDNAAFKARTAQYLKGAITANDLVTSFARDVAGKLPGVDLQDCVAAALETIEDKRKRDLLNAASEGREIGVGGATKTATVTARGRGDVTINGRRGQYVMQQRVQRVSSGRSAILSGAEIGKEGTPLKFKVANRSSAASIAAEVTNVERVRARNGAGSCSRHFVEYLECVENYNGRGDVVMIMRAESKDMRKLAESEGGDLAPGKLRKYVSEMFAIVRCFHKAGLVWTDLKLDNLVLCGGGEVKAIDLETAVPEGSAPKAFTPASLPPDVSASSSGGFGAVTVDRSYDVWGLGMAILHLCTGKGYFQGSSDPQIMAQLSSPGFAVDISEVKDDRLRRLLQGLLDVNPKKRVRFFDSPITRLSLL